MLPPYHQMIFKKLTHAFWKQRLGHAFLLVGEDNAEKKQFIETFEQFLLCRSPMIEGVITFCDRSWFKIVLTLLPSTKLNSFGFGGTNGALVFRRV